jgi:hypothetical protein
MLPLVCQPNLGRSLMDRVVYAVPCFVVEIEAMLFAAMLLNPQHEFLYAIALYLPIAVPSHNIRALELECSLVLFVREVWIQFVLLIHVVLLGPC